MQLVNIKTAAQRLGLHEITLRKRIRQERWPVYNLGAKGLRVDLDEILELTRVAEKPKQAVAMNDERRRAVSGGMKEKRR
jgi:hypothetical protein